MTHREIRAELIRLGIRQTELATKLGVSTAAVARVIRRQSRSKRIEKLIARVLNRSANEIWKDAA